MLLDFTVYVGCLLVLPVSKHFLSLYYQTALGSKAGDGFYTFLCLIYLHESMFK